MGPHPALLAVLLFAPALAGCVSELPGLGDRVAPPGGLAADYLRPGYGTVEIVIRAEEGTAPNREALADAETVLEGAIGKPVTFVVEAGLRAKGEAGVYSVEDLRALEREVRIRWTGGDTAVIHALYLAGEFEDEATVGLAYQGSSLAFFLGRIQESSAEGAADPSRCTPDNPAACCPLAPAAGGVGCHAPERRFIERSVLVHEVGHLLGLVNNGIPMVEDHEDPDHPGHSRNPDSVMYWEVAAPDFPRNYLSRGEAIPHHFDEADLGDLRAFAKG